MKKISYKQIKNVSVWLFSAILTPLTLGGVGGGLFTSCEDFFEQESDHVIFADKDHLGNAVDTIYSVMGIMDKIYKCIY